MIGVFEADRNRSSCLFAIRHMKVATFRSQKVERDWELPLPRAHEAFDAAGRLPLRALLVPVVTT